jgi:hypothetical protein
METRMKIRSTFITKIIAAMSALAFLVNQTSAQALLSAGTYTQNFDGLPNVVVSSNVWVNGVTLAGWYANTTNLPSANFGFNGEITNLVANVGSTSSGFLYSYGANALGDRALGSQAVNAMAASGLPAMAYGIRFTNDTGFALTNFSIAYTGEQWRNAGTTPAVAHSLAFGYRIDSSPITNADSRTIAAWTSVPALNFSSPTFSTSASALDGNIAANRAVISAVVLQGFAVLPGQEIFFRWLDTNEAGNDHALAIDDLTISFETNFAAVATAPTITANPASLAIGEGSSASFTVSANGTQPFTYEWYATNAGSGLLVGTSPSFTTNFVPLSANGVQFFVVISNSVGIATSTLATLTVTAVPVVVTNIAYLHTLQDANYALTNTTTLFQATGIVTTPANLVSGASVYSYHIQDATGGIDVFHRGGFTPLLPTVGDSVTVTGPLLQFNGLLEFSPTNANPTHSIVINSSGNALPTPMVFDFATINPALMESTFEGRYVVVSNVFLGITNVPALITAGGNVFMTNLTGQVFRLFNPIPAIDPQGNAVPVFARSVRGVMTQGDSTSPFDSSYSIYLTLFSDIEVGVAPPTPEPLTIQVVGSDVVLSWTQAAFNLQAAPAVTGTYTNIPGAASPSYTTPITGEQRYFRLNYTLP